MGMKFVKPLVILEIANNHMGDPEHGLKIIREFNQVTSDFPQYDFAFKFQYRNLDTFIHSEYKNRMDIKYIKRFSETKISKESFASLKEEAEALGFQTLCTPFDETSVTRIAEEQFKYIKIASCSFTDWPLLEEIAKTDLPIIASTAGASFEEIDRVVEFFQNRKKDFAIMHCVAEYPTSQANQQLNTIDILKKRYPEVAVGFSTHEDPNNTINVIAAVAKGVQIFERHVGVATDDYQINGYSSTPEQLRAWLNSMNEAFIACGETTPESRVFTADAKQALLGLRRGVFAKELIKKGEIMSSDKLFLAIPGIENQVQANDLSKYTDFIAKEDISANSPVVLHTNSEKIEKRDRVSGILKNVQRIVEKSGIIIPQKIDIDISHHYGIDHFEDVGCTLITFINREYCKKLMISLPNQSHPTHHHEQKEESFNILYGSVTLTLDDEEKEYHPGDIIIIKRGVKHSFSSQTGAIIEEISSAHMQDDSFYSDSAITEYKNRKTRVSYWPENLK